jgi:hypothetical protein
MTRFALPTCLIAALFLAACDETTVAVPRMDGPWDLAVLQPDAGFYEVPVGFATNLRSGRVSKLDMKRGGHVVEDGPAPWMPGPELAFGSGRALSQIALITTPDSVDVWVTDDGSDQLLRAPHISGLEDDGTPIWVRPTLGDVTVTDAAGAALGGDLLPTLRGLRLHETRAAQEVWTMVWKGQSFSVHGSTAGAQAKEALPGSPYTTDQGELAFTAALNGQEPEFGTTIHVPVLHAIESVDAGGLVQDLLVSDDGAWVFAVVLPDTGAASLAVFDALSFTEIDRIDLPAGSVPERMTADHFDGRAWVADSADVDGAGRVLRLDWIPGDLDTLAITPVPVPEPAIDVDPGADPDADRLFVAAAFSDALWMLDGTTYAPLDVNPITPEIDPTRVSTLISGIASSERPIETWDLSDADVRIPVYGIFVSTFAGELYWVDASTGCQVFANWVGAYLDSGFADPQGLFNDGGFTSDPQLITDPYQAGASSTDVNVFDAGWVATSRCGGVTRSETWVARYDEVEQSYEVEGSFSGVQEGRAFEGDRYITDGGELSFLIQPGALPTTQGDFWRFIVNDGVTPILLGELPGDPVVYTELYDDRSGRWWALRQREIAAVPNSGNDMVFWIDVQDQGFNASGVRIYR